MRQPHKRCSLLLVPCPATFAMLPERARNHRRVRHALCATFCSGLRLSEVREIGSYGAASAYGLVGQPALEDSEPSRGRVPLASCFVPTMQRATPGTRTLPSLSNSLTLAMAFARIRSRASSSTC